MYTITSPYKKLPSNAAFLLASQLERHQISAFVMSKTPGDLCKYLMNEINHTVINLLYIQ